ncbi:GrpB protein, partial [Paenibacillus sp. NFR01]
KSYELLKIKLAETYRYDIDNYSLMKTEFVTDVLNKTIYRAKGK